jgi:hypothetical protein
MYIPHILKRPTLVSYEPTYIRSHGQMLTFFGILNPSMHPCIYIILYSLNDLVYILKIYTTLKYCFGPLF